MSSLKGTMIRVIQEQPEDATYEEILRELAFHRMVERGLADSREGRVLSSEDMSRRMDEWRKEGGVGRVSNASAKSTITSAQITGAEAL